ncbi:MAG: radical SAM family RiPP maturation amino acid epimerase [Lachnospiraceae bacterium]|nr:radical SAM family RiPP maturation amino acid epimerase [Lachnospiraceae bacterium]
MTSHEIELCKLNNAQMPRHELVRITQLVADTKRFVEMYSLLPYMREELDRDFALFLAKHSLNVDEEGMKLLAYEDYEEQRQSILKAPNKEELIPESVYRFNQFLANKLAFRDRMIDELCKPSNIRMSKWRDRQMNRCLAGIGGINKSFVHSPLTIELDKGCSVGCEFCGLGAEKLTKICRHTEENGRLFSQIISDAHKLIGNAAGFGTLYLATEPLDNPDYELYEADFVREFGFIPQITTAVPDRDIERTRRLIGEFATTPGYIHRFSIRSLEMAERIFSEFTPMELLQVELLPQFEEAPTFVPFTVVGDEAKRVDPANAREMDPGTICCADGFVINMAERSIRLITPCHMTKEFPNGIAESEKRYFDSADECNRLMEEMIDEYMIIDLPSDEPLKLYPYLERCMTQYGDSIKSTYGGSIFALDKLSKSYAKRAVDLLIEGKYDKYGIVNTIENEYDVAPQDVFWFLNQMWKQGYIYDSRLFEM